MKNVKEMSLKERMKIIKVHVATLVNKELKDTDYELARFTMLIAPKDDD